MERILDDLSSVQDAFEVGWIGNGDDPNELSVAPQGDIVFDDRFPIEQMTLIINGEFKVSFQGFSEVPEFDQIIVIGNVIVDPIIRANEVAFFDCDDEYIATFKFNGAILNSNRDFGDISHFSVTTIKRRFQQCSRLVKSISIASPMPVDRILHLQDIEFIGELDNSNNYTEVLPIISGNIENFGPAVRLRPINVSLDGEFVVHTDFLQWLEIDDPVELIGTTEQTHLETYYSICAGEQKWKSITVNSVAVAEQVEHLTDNIIINSVCSIFGYYPVSRARNLTIKNIQSTVGIDYILQGRESVNIPGVQVNLYRYLSGYNVTVNNIDEPVIELLCLTVRNLFCKNFHLTTFKPLNPSVITVTDTNIPGIIEISRRFYKQPASAWFGQYGRFDELADLIAEYAVGRMF